MRCLALTVRCLVVLATGTGCGSSVESQLVGSWTVQAGGLGGMVLMTLGKPVIEFRADGTCTVMLAGGAPNAGTWTIEAGEPPVLVIRETAQDQPDTDRFHVTMTEDGSTASLVPVTDEGIPEPDGTLLLTRTAD